ncbi:MAG: NTE family protein rssA, partial [Hyphomicrobium sp.]|nr:NTE family protein rssA [Hyphomicrobium sp.]
GARYVIAVNLNFDICGRGTIVPHLEPDMDNSELTEQPTTGKNGSGMRGLLKRQVLGKSEATPGISSVMVEAFNIVQDRIARSRLAGDPPDAMINLRLSDMGLFDFHRADELISRGQEATKRHLAEMHREIDARRIAPGAHTGITQIA